MLQEHQKIYDELRPFYQLLYIYDIEKFDPKDLKSLAIRLNQQLNLDQKERLIYDELIVKSKANTTKRLDQKRLTRQMKNQRMTKGSDRLEIKPKEDKKFVKKSQKPVENSFLSVIDYEEQSCVIGYRVFKPKYQQKRAIQGKIYEGKMLIQLTITNPKRNISEKALFEISSYLDDSTINPQTLRKISINNNSQYSTLLVEGKMHQCKVLETNDNTIGLNYLRVNNVIVRANFRTQQSTFSMIFTQ